MATHNWTQQSGKGVWCGALVRERGGLCPSPPSRKPPNGHNRCKGGTHTARCQLINQSIATQKHMDRLCWCNVKIGIIFQTFALKVSHLQTPAVRSLYTLHSLSPMLKCLRTYFSLWTNWTNKSVEDQGCQFPFNYSAWVFGCIWIDHLAFLHFPMSLETSPSLIQLEFHQPEPPKMRREAP